MIAYPPELERAIAQHRQGDIASARPVYEELSRTRSELAEPWHLLGVIELQTGAPDKAEPLFREALARDAAHVKCRSNLGGALYQLNRLDEAEAELLRALELDPDYTDARYNLGNVLAKAGRDEDAMAAFDAVLTAQPQHIKALDNAGVLYFQHHRFDQAEDYFRRALDIDPDDQVGLVNLARVRERQNRIEEAESLMNRALEHDPNCLEANLFSAQIDYRQKRFDDALTKLKICITGTQDPEILAQAHYALGLTHDSRNEAADAFRAFAMANDYERRDMQGGKADPTKYMDHIRAAHARLNTAPFPPKDENATGQPVFFVGFPRSGTTLLEQMLAAHPGVMTSNEVSPLDRVGREMLKGAAPHALDERALDAYRARFWQHAKNSLGDIGGRTLVDKMPLNIEFLDIASRLFPGAKILMALRDPRDACLSCFMQHFERNNAMANFLSLDGTAALYDQVMGLWLKQRDVLPLAWMEYRYEDLVQDMEGVVKPILAFLELDWNDDILGYRDQTQDGRVITPSYAQIGEKLYSQASGRWVKYARFLEPVYPTLAPYIDAFGYNN